MPQATSTKENALTGTGKFELRALQSLPTEYTANQQSKIPPTKKQVPIPAPPTQSNHRDAPRPVTSLDHDIPEVIGRGCTVVPAQRTLQPDQLTGSQPILPLTPAPRRTERISDYSPPSQVRGPRLYSPDVGNITGLSATGGMVKDLSHATTRLPNNLPGRRGDRLGNVSAHQRLAIRLFGDGTPAKPLAVCRAAKIVPVGRVSTAIVDGKGSTGDRLRSQRLPLALLTGLGRDHPCNVVFERNTNYSTCSKLANPDSLTPDLLTHKLGPACGKNARADSLHQNCRGFRSRRGWRKNPAGNRCRFRSRPTAQKDKNSGRHRSRRRNSGRISSRHSRRGKADEPTVATKPVTRRRGPGLAKNVTVITRQTSPRRRSKSYRAPHSSNYQPAMRLRQAPSNRVTTPRIHFLTGQRHRPAE